MHQIRVNGLTIDVVRKKIKNLHLAVYPPHGRVRVAAPLAVNDEAVRLAIISRWAWIKRQQAKFAAQERQSARLFVTGETHFFQGRRYRLTIEPTTGKQSISFPNRNKLVMHVAEDSTEEQRKLLLNSWYRKYLKDTIPPLIEKWEPIIGVEVADWGVKLMKTKWGTCNIEAKRIWLNLELAKKPVTCLEYIVVHEMVHLLERHHNDKFTGYLDKFYPRWRQVRHELNQAPLLMLAPTEPPLD
jgi:predicted metal-dependent hydrolase